MCAAAQYQSQTQPTLVQTPPHPHGTPANTAVAAATASKLWAQAHTLSATLLHDSMPCMKRSKRPLPPLASQNVNDSKAVRKQHPRVHAASACVSSSSSTGDQVDVAACINVLFGTLLKLYPLGAKTPTFKARVAMTTRLMDLSTLPITEQNTFLAEHASLVRLCFMEYLLNALVDWLPCERELLLRTCPPMDTYLRIAGSMCDIFRQDALVTGREPWELLNRAAAASIERCIRVCKFKVKKIETGSNHDDDDDVCCALTSCHAGTEASGAAVQVCAHCACPVRRGRVRHAQDDDWEKRRRRRRTWNRSKRC